MSRVARYAELGRPELAGRPPRGALVEVGVVMGRAEWALTVPHVMARLRERGIALPEAEVREALEELVAAGKIRRIGARSYAPPARRWEWEVWPD